MNNPVNLTDPTGMAPEGRDDWIELKSKEGNRQFIYDSDITTKEQAQKKGYKNVQNVSVEMTVNSGDDSYKLSDKATVTDLSTGNDVKPGFHTSDGTYIGENNMSKATARGLQKGGDAMVYGGIAATVSGGGVVGTPSVLIGGITSGVGSGLELVNDAIDGKFSMEKALMKVGLFFIGSKIGKIGRNQSEKVINEGLINILDKAVDDARDNKKGPYK